MHHDMHQFVTHVSNCLQLGILLEISANKPGNVSRVADFQGTRYEHFLASAVAIRPSLAVAAKQGAKISRGEIEPSSVGIGKIMKSAVEEVSVWQHGGNTLLGTILLLSPLAVAAGMSFSDNNKFSRDNLRRSLKQVSESTSPLDAVAVYEAINIANPNGLANMAPTLDVNDPASKKKILEEKINLFEIFRISASYDSISREWVENFPITFDIGLPFFIKQLEVADLNTAIVRTFLKVLARVPDTLIRRKAGKEKAEEISERAGKILSGLSTPKGRKELLDFDEELRGSRNKLNPGTTADITATVLAVSILDGYRP